MKRPKRAVLVVDDDLDIREALTDILEDRGFSVMSAANGREALALLAAGCSPRGHPARSTMPIMDGYGFLEEHRKDASLAVIPVAIITAGNGVDRSRIDEVTSIVPKPINVPRSLRYPRPSEYVARERSMTSAHSRRTSFSSSSRASGLRDLHCSSRGHITSWNAGRADQGRQVKRAGEGEGSVSSQREVIERLVFSPALSRKAGEGDQYLFPSPREAAAERGT